MPYPRWLRHLRSDAGSLRQVAETPADQHYPGQKFGLPPAGPGSAAGWGRRIAALLLDWVLSLMFVAAFVGSGVWGAGGLAQWGPLLVFALQRWVLVVLLGGSAAQMVLGLRVQRTSGGGLDPLRSLVRVVLVCLVVPAAIFNNDRQGVHDMAADSIVVRA